MSREQSQTNYFLLKSEPHEFSIQDLAKVSIEEWDGVRNFEARNIMRSMKVGDRAFFYHSSCKETGVVGTVTISREAQPDVTAYEDPKHPGFDIKSSKERCRWDSVQVRLETIYPVTVLLKELKAQAKNNDLIAGMTLLRRSRLSVSKVSPEEWQEVEGLVERKLGGEELMRSSLQESQPSRTC
jgi:predicted RNA-binding protein with PUA-like domain